MLHSDHWLVPLELATTISLLAFEQSPLSPLGWFSQQQHFHGQHTKIPFHGKCLMSPGRTRDKERGRQVNNFVLNSHVMWYSTEIGPTFNLFLIVQLGWYHYGRLEIKTQYLRHISIEKQIYWKKPISFKSYCTYKEHVLQLLQSW